MGPLGPLGLKFSQLGSTTRPSVERTAGKSPPRDDVGAIAPEIALGIPKTLHSCVVCDVWCGTCLAGEEDVVGVLDLHVHLPDLQPVRLVEPRNLHCEDINFKPNT